MKKFLTLFILTLFGFLVLIGGCASKMIVESTPPGAKIYINDKDTNFKTPHNFHIDDKNIITGDSLSVKKDGFLTPAPVIVKRRPAVGRIVVAVIMPIPFAIIGLIRGFTRYEKPKVKFHMNMRP